MNITAAQVTGKAYVVAPNEVRALEEFAADRRFHEEDEAVRHENYLNAYGRYPDDAPDMNTYKIVVTAEMVH